MNNNNTDVCDCTLKVDMQKLANLAIFRTFSIDYLEILGRKQKKSIYLKVQRHIIGILVPIS